tara:strand:- start:1210 stop:1410 length:201 start_codon:yes stop_codon:yes gene_type:complete
MELINMEEKVSHEHTWKTGGTFVSIHGTVHIYECEQCGIYDLKIEGCEIVGIPELDPHEYENKEAE